MPSLPPEANHLAPFTQPQKVLDQGFVRLVSVMGDDGFIVEVARVTTGKGRSAHKWEAWQAAEADAGRPFMSYLHECSVCKTKHTGLSPEPTDNSPCLAGDRNMLRYMFKHQHSSPFEFAEIVLHMRLPMDVWRQMVRHRTASVSEYSTRYSPAVDAMAATDPDQWRLQSKTNRQGSGGLLTEWPTKLCGLDGWVADPESGLLLHENRAPIDVGIGNSPGAYLSEMEADLQAMAAAVYRERLEFGVAFEQARKDLPLSNYTDVFWKIDLRNLLHFLGLRLDGHAQTEIRAYANVIAEIVKLWVPQIWEAFEDYQLYATLMSRMDMQALRGFVLRVQRTLAATMHPNMAANVIQGMLVTEAKEAQLSQRETDALLTSLLPEEP